MFIYLFIIYNRPHKSGNYYPKTPTLSLYKRSDPTQLVDWGNSARKAMLKPQADKSNILLSNFKLNLDAKLKRPPLENGL